jgi:hypothetical protein
MPDRFPHNLGTIGGMAESDRPDSPPDAVLAADAPGDDADADLDAEEPAPEAPHLAAGGHRRREHRGDDQPAPDGCAFACTQTPPRAFSPSGPPARAGSLADARGGELVRLYHRAVADHVQAAHVSDLSELRGEICERMQHRRNYQVSAYGRASIGLDDPPPNLFSSFSVALYLVIYEDGRFAFSSATPGVALGGLIDDDEGRALLFYIAHGVLRPGLLPALLDLKLAWYDGALICEVVDRRRRLGRAVRTHLRVAEEDLVPFGADAEQQVLLAQYPLLCLEPTPQVANDARVAGADRRRWEPSDIDGESKLLFVAKRSPGIFVRAEARAPPPRVTQEQEDEYRRLMVEKLLSGAA